MPTFKLSQVLPTPASRLAFIKAFEPRLRANRWNSFRRGDIPNGFNKTALPIVDFHWKNLLRWVLSSQCVDDDVSSHDVAVVEDLMSLVAIEVRYVLDSEMKLWIVNRMQEMITDDDIFAVLTRSSSNDDDTDADDLEVVLCFKCEGIGYPFPGDDI